jgi:hypothetical protein
MQKNYYLERYVAGTKLRATLVKRRSGGVSTTENANGESQISYEDYNQTAGDVPECRNPLIEKRGTRNEIRACGKA